METIQIVLEEDLLRAADRVARRLKVNRSSLFREALRAHLAGLARRERERADRAGYARQPGSRRGGRGLGEGGGMAGGVERGRGAAVPVSTPDKQRPVLVLTRDSAVSYLTRVTGRPDHLHDPRRALRGAPSDSGRRR